ncbi:MAG: hypothetical protein ABIJ09_05975 [Pseudomonadota bacterium]
MNLKSQILLVAILFVVFAALSVLSSMRRPSRSRRLARRRSRSAASADDEDSLQMQTAEVPDEAPRRQLSPLLVGIAVALAVGAALAVLWTSAAE